MRHTHVHDLPALEGTVSSKQGQNRCFASTFSLCLCHGYDFCPLNPHMTDRLLWQRQLGRAVLAAAAASVLGFCKLVQVKRQQNGRSLPAGPGTRSLRSWCSGRSAHAHPRIHPSQEKQAAVLAAATTSVLTDERKPLKQSRTECLGQAPDLSGPAADSKANSQQLQHSCLSRNSLPFTAARSRTHRTCNRVVSAQSQGRLLQSSRYLQPPKACTQIHRSSKLRSCPGSFLTFGWQHPLARTLTLRVQHGTTATGRNCRFGGAKESLFLFLRALRGPVGILGATGLRVLKAQNLCGSSRALCVEVLLASFTLTTSYDAACSELQTQRMRERLVDGAVSVSSELAAALRCMESYLQSGPTRR